MRGGCRRRAFARELIVDEVHPEPWDVLDLRRLKSVDPTVDALATAFGARENAEGWTLNVEREDVCPVIRIPEGADFDGFLATLGKKERHEIRRKVRRAEAGGAASLVARPSTRDLDAFLDLHQRAWARWLFPRRPAATRASSSSDGCSSSSVSARRP